MNRNQEQLLQEYRQGRVQPERAGDYWGKEERKDLARYYDEGRGISEMALLFNRGEMAIYQQLIGLDLFTTPATTRYRGKREKTPKCPLCGKKVVCPECENHKEDAYA